MNRIQIGCGVLLLAAGGMTVLAGCARTRGPKLVLNSHIDYNKAVSQVLKEELLLNVVRRWKSGSALSC